MDKSVSNKSNTVTNNFRNLHFYISVIAAIVIVFASVLILSVTTSYLSNKNAYSDSLSARVEYQVTHIDEHIRSYVMQTIFLGSNANIVKLFSNSIGSKDELAIQENKIADDIWDFMGDFDFFVGATLEGTDGTLYLQNTKLKDFNSQIDKIVDIKKSDFQKDEYVITFGEYQNDSVFVISAPVINSNKEICGYIHVVLNHLAYYLSKKFDNREEYLFDYNTLKALSCDDFICADECRERVNSIKNLNNKVAHAVKENKKLITYENTKGEKMIGAIEVKAPFVLLAAVSSKDMTESIFPFTAFQIATSAFLMCLLVILIYLLYNRTTKPVTDMIEHCSRLAKGEDVGDIKPSQDDDLNKLAQAFNSYRKRLENAAYSDTLLNIGTRHKYIRDIDAVISAGNIDKFCIFTVDIREFGKYNDVFSIGLGDKLLIEVSKRLSTIFKNLYRIDGDVFLGMLPQTDNFEIIADKIHQIVKNKIIIGSFEFELQCRVSICSYPTHGQSAAVLMEKAQSALHQIKKKTISDTVFYNDEMIEDMRRENEILTLLLRRIEDKTLEVWYQPIYHVNSKKYESAEALLRLKDDNGVYLSPFEVILIAEKNHVVDLVGRYVLLSACSMLKKLDTLEKCDLKYIQINLSVQELACNDFASKALDLIRREGIEPSRIGMEVTETMVIQSFSGAIETLGELRNSGIQIAMDDFGSGYSGINYLANLPFDILKLDKELVAQVDQGEEQCAFVKTIVQLAKIKNIITVAEGVETNETLNKMLFCNIDCIQGYYYSKPLCEAELINFIKNKREQLN